MIVAGRVFLRGESAAVQRLTAEHVEVVEGDDRAGDDFRLAAARESEVTSFIAARLSNVRARSR